MRRKSLILALVGIMALFVFQTTDTINAQETLWVRDETNQLNPDTLDLISKLNEEMFSEYELQPQLGIEILYDLPSDVSSMDEYRNQRFEELGVGHGEYDSGLLYILALNSRESGIEVGYGLEHIITDLEANRILTGDMRQYLQQYSTTADPIHLNNAVKQAAIEMATLLEKADSGVLFEERAEAERLRQDSIVITEGIMAGTIKLIFVLVITFVASLLTFFAISCLQDKRKEKQRLAMLSDVQHTLNAFLNEDDSMAIAREELSASRLDHCLTNNVLGTSTIEGLMAVKHNPQEFIHHARAKYFASNLQTINETGKRYSDDYYVANKRLFLELIQANDTYTIKEFIQDMDDVFDEQTKQMNEGLEALNTELKTHQGHTKEPDFLSKEELYSLVVAQLIHRLNLNHSGVQGLDVSHVTQGEKLKRDIQNVYKDVVITEAFKAENENHHFTYEYGSQSEFISEAKGKLLKKGVAPDDLMLSDSRHALIYPLYTRYKRRKADAYQETLRVADIRRARAVEAERIRSTLSSSSSFGSGFGGGSSGGGGASSGW